MAARIPSDSLSVEQCIRWLSKTSRSPGSISTGSAAAHVVVDDLEVAVVGARAAVRDVRVHRLGLRAGQHVEAPVDEGRLGHGQPDADDGPRRLEREVEGVLVPGLPPGTRRLEDELGQEDVDVGGDQLGDEVDDVGRVGEAGEDRVAVQLEDLGHPVLGVAPPARPALLLSGSTLTPSSAARPGSRTTSVTRSSIAAHVSGGAKPPMRKKPRSVHEDRCCGRERGHQAIGSAGGSGSTPSGRGQASGVTSLAMTAPMAIPARSTAGCGKRPSPRVDPSAK